MQSELTKTCKKCNQEKSVNDFYFNNFYKDGRSATCKICENNSAKEKRLRAKSLDNKLTFIEEIGTDKHGNKTARYKCECDGEIISIIYKVKTNATRSCGCLKNLDKRKPFPIEIIPQEYRHLIEPDVESIQLGNKHHRQWCSRVTCLVCGFTRLLRNERVIANIHKYGFPYVCTKCCSEVNMKKVDPEIIRQAQKEYLESDMSWKKIVEKHNVPEHVLSKCTNGKLITQMRRLKKRREAVARMEQELLQQQQAYVAKEKAELTEWEEKIKTLVGAK